MPQLHRNAHLEVAIGIENAFLGTHRSRDDPEVGCDDHAATAVFRISNDLLLIRRELELADHVVVDNAAQSVARFRQNGLTVTDTNVSDTKAVLANITDPYMGRIELAELTPESMHFKAIQSWK